MEQLAAEEYISQVQGLLRSDFALFVLGACRLDLLLSAFDAGCLGLSTFLRGVSQVWWVGLIRSCQLQC